MSIKTCHNLHKDRKIQSNSRSALPRLVRGRISTSDALLAVSTTNDALMSSVITKNNFPSAESGPLAFPAAADIVIIQRNVLSREQTQKGYLEYSRHRNRYRYQVLPPEVLCLFSSGSLNLKAGI